jgi:hypothetical protein
VVVVAAVYGWLGAAAAAVYGWLGAVWTWVERWGKPSCSRMQCYGSQPSRSSWPWGWTGLGRRQSRSWPRHTAYS